MFYFNGGIPRKSCYFSKLIYIDRVFSKSESVEKLMVFASASLPVGVSTEVYSMANDAKILEAGALVHQSNFNSFQIF